MAPVQRVSILIRGTKLTDGRHLWECSNHVVARWERLGRAKFQ